MRGSCGRNDTEVIQLSNGSTEGGEMMFGYTKTIYVAGKYQNDKKNKEYIEDCCRMFSKEYPTCLFINGVSQFGYMYNEVPTLKGIEMCIEFMRKACDEVWTVGEYTDSVGTNCEILVAKALNIPVKEKMDKEVAKTLGDIK